MARAPYRQPRKRDRGRPPTGQTKVRQIGRVPEAVWQAVLRGHRASGSRNFTRWATAALLQKARQESTRRKRIERLTRTIVRYDLGEIHGVNIARARELLRRLLEQE